MDEEKLNEQLDKIVNTINANYKVKEMLVLKEKIYQDENIKTLLDKFHELNNEYSTDYIEIKKELLTNQTLKEYRNLEKELYFLILDFNKKLNKLIDRKKCD